MNQKIELQEAALQKAKESAKRVNQALEKIIQQESIIPVEYSQDMVIAKLQTEIYELKQINKLLTDRLQDGKDLINLSRLETEKLTVIFELLLQALVKK